MNDTNQIKKLNKHGNNNIILKNTIRYMKIAKEIFNLKMSLKLKIEVISSVL